MFEIIEVTIKHTHKNINVITIHHTMFILLLKRGLKNNQPLLDQHDSL